MTTQRHATDELVVVIHHGDSLASERAARHPILLLRGLVDPLRL